MRWPVKIWLSGALALLMSLASVYFFITRNQGNYTRQVSYANLYETQTKAAIGKWSNAADIYTPEEKAAGKALSFRAAGITGADSDFDKMMKIGGWLQQSLRQCPRGTPTADFERLEILEQYAAAKKNQSPIWCGTYAELFFFFCSVNNINCRYIETITGNNHHIINECYIPETGRWLFADIMNDALCVRDQQGNWMNTADILLVNAGKNNAVPAFYSHVDSDSLVLKDLPAGGIPAWNIHLNKASVLHYYYSLDLGKVYSPAAKTIRYIYPKTWYEIFTLTTVSNARFYWRLFFLYYLFLYYSIYYLFDTL